MRRCLFYTLPAITALMLLLAAPARAGDPTIDTDEDGRAIRGYDAVAYFTEGAARPGSPDFAFDWNGATWLFASAAHRDAFAANPEAYAPQFGGYCAYAVAKDHVAEGDPRVWAVVDGRLYLNVASGVQKMWEAERPAMIAAARNNWPEVLAGPVKQGDKPGAGDR